MVLNMKIQKTYTIASCRLTQNTDSMEKLALLTLKPSECNAVIPDLFL